MIAQYSSCKLFDSLIQEMLNLDAANSLLAPTKHRSFKACRPDPLFTSHLRGNGYTKVDSLSSSFTRLSVITLN